MTTVSVPQIVLEDHVQEHPASGRLVRFLEDWCHRFLAITFIILAGATARHPTAIACSLVRSSKTMFP